MEKSISSVLFTVSENSYQNAYSSSLKVMIFFKKHNNRHSLSTQVREQRLATLVRELGVPS